MAIKRDRQEFHEKHVEGETSVIPHGDYDLKHPYENSLDPLSNGSYFLAASPQMLHIRKQALKFAPIDAPVFITGESGVGKEVIAQFLHLRSRRAEHPFVKVNCAALPDHLLESELFGYEEGSFTGACHKKLGQFEIANKGTIFLDEVAEMSINLQAKLLHVLQDQQYLRLGGRDVVQSDVRVIAATNADVLQELACGELRKDLYYRLNMLSIIVPPLCERAAEIPSFFRHFHQKYNAKFKRETTAPSEDLLRAAARYRWPGNVRELENFVKRYVILGSEEDRIQELHSLVSIQPDNNFIELAASSCERGLKETLRDAREVIKTELIGAALTESHWNRRKCAAILGISYTEVVKHARRMKLREQQASIRNRRIPTTLQTRNSIPIEAGT